jgi:hypothetical protein
MGILESKKQNKASEEVFASSFRLLLWVICARACVLSQPFASMAGKVV